MKTKQIGLKIIFILAFFCFPAFGQNLDSKKPQPDWIFDIPSSPVKISFDTERKRQLFFTYFGDAEVIRIRLGIIRIENGKYQIISKKSFVEINGGKLPNGVTQFSGIVKHLKEIDSATEKKGKLAIISVAFNDGSVWNAKSN